MGGVHPALIQPLMQLLASLDSNTTVDLSSPHLRSLFSKNTWLLVIVIVLYTLLIILGLLGNLLLLIMLLRLKTLSNCFSCICCTNILTEHLIPGNVYIWAVQSNAVF